MVSERVVSRSFVARVPELEHLAARRRDAAEGRGGAVLVSGDAGIGKSRIIDEFLKRAGGAGAAMATECRPFAQRPLDPIADLLGRLTGSPWDPTAAELGSRAAFVEAIVEAFDRACARRLRTIVIEDLHFADPELIQIFSLLAGRAAHRRLLVVGTYRDVEMTSAHPSFHVLGRLLRHSSVTQIVLEPLTSAELAGFVGGVLRDAAVNLPGAVVRDVCRRSGGNPLFAEELLRHAVDASRVGERVQPTALPFSLQAVIRERVERCSPAEQQLLAQASAFGRRFSLDVLCEVVGVDAQASRALLQRPCDLQLVEPVDRTGNFQFRHALTRDAVYSELGLEEAQRVHERIAEAIERRADAGSFVELLAHSFWEAGALARAAPYCRAAGDGAHRMHAYDEAVMWYERAAAGFENAGADAAQALYAAARCATRLEDPERAFPVLERAIAVLSERGDHRGVVRARKDAAGAYFNHGRSREALAHLQAALDAAGQAAEPALRFEVLIRMLALHAALRDVAAAQQCASQIDESALDERAMATGEYFFVRSSLHAQLGEIERWRAAFERGVAVLEGADETGVTLRYALTSVARQALDLGDTETAHRFAVRSLELAESLKTDQVYARALLAEVELRAGRLDSVSRHLRAMPQPREYIARQSVAVTAARAAMHLGNDEALRGAIDLDLIAEAEAGGNRFAVGTLAAAFGSGLEHLGEGGAADRLFERARAVITASYGRALDIVAIARCRPRRAASLLGVITSVPGAETPVDEALFAFLHAVVAHHGGDEAAAARFGADAARRFAGIGWPLLEAQSWEIAGRGRAALALYRRLGAFGDVRRLSRAGANAQDGRECAAVLTPREQELAQLIARGKGNSAAAESLGISRKAVEKYLTTIYRKLGIQSRAQLAVYMVATKHADAAN